MKAVDQALEWTMRHERPISIVGAIWFAISCLATARMIKLPELPFVTESQLFWGSVAWNGLWWGLLYYLIDDRKKKLRDAGTTRANNEHG